MSESRLLMICKAVEQDYDLMMRVRAACVLAGYDGMLTRFYFRVAEMVAGQFVEKDGVLITSGVSDEAIIKAVHEAWKEIGYA